MNTVRDRITRHKKIRSRISGIKTCPRLFVFRSNQHIYASLIDDKERVTIASISDGQVKAKGTKSEKAMLVGEKIALKAKDLGINKVVFDRGGYLYHGRVKAVAEGARKGGLNF